jgi:hypothetical protein
MDWLRAPRMQVVWEVLDAVLEIGDQLVIDARCRLIDAQRRGLRKQQARKDSCEVAKTFAPELKRQVDLAARSVEMLAERA